jgi:hypothetical protein
MILTTTVPFLGTVKGDNKKKPALYKRYVFRY